MAEILSENILIKKTSKERRVKKNSCWNASYKFSFRETPFKQKMKALVDYGINEKLLRIVIKFAGDDGEKILRV